MLTKILTVVLIATLLARLGLVRWAGLGQWFKRFVDVALFTIAVVYGIQLVMILRQ